MKDVVFDLGKNQNTKTPENIDGRDVDWVKSYKYLDVTIQDDLKWDSHVELVKLK